MNDLLPESDDMSRDALTIDLLGMALKRSPTAPEAALALMSGFTTLLLARLDKAGGLEMFDTIVEESRRNLVNLYDFAGGGR